MIAQSVAEIISRHVRLTVEGIDRMYLNVFVPDLQYEQGIVHFFRTHRGQPLPSAALMSPMTRSFVAGARFASYGLASHAAIINGNDSRKGRRLSLPTKISKTTPCKVAWRSLAWML